MRPREPPWQVVLTEANREIAGDVLLTQVIERDLLTQSVRLQLALDVSRGCSLKITSTGR